MLFYSVLLLASFSVFPVLAAPISIRRQIARAASGGWPESTGGDAKGAFGISGGFKQSYLKTIDGQPTLVGNYPKGSYAGSKAPGPGISGFIFQASGGPDVKLDNAKEAKLTYQVKFPKSPVEFDFVEGGKMPGLYGGSDPATSAQCAGGTHREYCWSARLMWRKAGEGELYAYLPTANQKLGFCKDKCDVKYGASIGTGSWSFQLGEATQVTERVKLNDVGQMNGEIEVLINGESKVSLKGLQLRGDDKGRIRGAMVHSFFGGSSDTKFQSTKNQEAYFWDFKIEVTEPLK